MSPRRDWRSTQRGQAFVIMVGVILLSTALLGLVIDGGNVLTQQRLAQSGADASAEAGAIVLARKLAGATTPVGGWDAVVAQKVQQSAKANSLTVRSAYYTDICGIPLLPNGNAALKGDGTENLSGAAQVGGGLPASAGTTPDCPSLVVGPPAGILVIADKIVPSYVAGAINLQSFTVTVRAAAVSGYLQSYCDSSQGTYCAVMPLTIPGFVPQCNSGGKLAPGEASWTSGVIYKIGLCGNDPGNVGWIDWTPPGGGALELVCAIINPSNPAVLIPSWQYVVQTGNVNGGDSCTDADTGVVYTGVEAAFRKYDGRVVLVPQFTQPNCNPPSGISPNQSQVSTAPNYGCDPAYQGGSGQNQWYRITSFAFLRLCAPAMEGCNGLHGAYLQGSNEAICGQGNGQTGCIIGKLVDIMATGTVAAGGGAGTGTKAIGVQLIK